MVPLNLPNNPETPGECSQSVSKIQTGTQRDALLSCVFHFTMERWLINTEDENLHIFKDKKIELSTLDSCIMWSNCVIIPTVLRPKIQLHEGHPGISRMKSLERMLIWWPGFDQDVESIGVGTVWAMWALAPPPPPPPPNHD